MVRPIPTRPGEVPTQEQLEWELNEADVSGATGHEVRALIARYMLDRYKMRRRFARQWRKDAPDHWSTCDGVDPTLSAWSCGDAWVWEAWDEGRLEIAEPSATGVAADLAAAKRAAEAYRAAPR